MLAKGNKVSMVFNFQDNKLFKLIQENNTN